MSKPGARRSGRVVLGAAVLLIVGLAVAIYVAVARKVARVKALRLGTLFVHEEADAGQAPSGEIKLGDGDRTDRIAIHSEGLHDGTWLGTAAMPPRLRRGLDTGHFPSEIWWGGAMVPVDAAAALRVRDAWVAAGRPGHRWWHLSLAGRGAKRVAQLELRDSQLTVSVPIASPFDVPHRLGPDDRITRRITTFWAQGSPVPARMASVWNAWRRQHPGYEFRVYDDAAARAMLVHFFDPRVVAAYDALIPLSYRSDLFAACAIFVYGGFFIDAKITPAPMFSFEDHVPHDVDLYMTPKLWNVVGVRDGFWKGIMGAKPGSPVMREVIDRICDRVEALDRGSTPLDTTGDHLYGRAFAAVFNLRRRSFSAGTRRLTDRFGNEHTIMMSKSRLLPLPDHVVDADGMRIMNVTYPGYRVDQAITSGLPHYKKLWAARRVFREDVVLPGRGPAFPLRRAVRAIQQNARLERRRRMRREDAS